MTQDKNVIHGQYAPAVEAVENLENIHRFARAFDQPLPRDDSRAFVFRLLRGDEPEPRFLDGIERDGLAFADDGGFMFLAAGDHGADFLSVGLLFYFCSF